MHSTIQERLDALEARFVSLGLCPPDRADLMDAVRDIATEQDKVTRRNCAESIIALAETKEFRLFVDLQRAQSAILNTRSLYP